MLALPLVLAAATQIGPLGAPPHNRSLCPAELGASAAPCAGVSAANASACAGAGCCFYPANSQHVAPSHGYGRIAWPWPAHTYNERRPGTVEVLLFW